MDAVPLGPGAGRGEPAGQSPQLWMGHAARHHAGRGILSAERLARGGIGQAGVTAAPFAAWIDDWQMTGRAAAGSRCAVGAAT